MLIKMALEAIGLGLDIFGAIFGGKKQDVAPEAQRLKNGDLMIQLDPDTRQIIFSVEEDNTITPIIIDLKNHIIRNASLEVAPPDVGPTI
jgi:hypothetical protein